MKTTQNICGVGRARCGVRKLFINPLATTIRVASGLLATLPFVLKAAVAGICLQAYSPEIPPNKIECFEYEKYERIANGYRFFLSSGSSVVVSNYRFRNIVTYRSGLSPGNQEFDKTLTLYEKTATEVPSTRIYLNARIQQMRTLAAAHQRASQESAALPRINIGGEEYFSPDFKRCEDGYLLLTHRDGTAKIDLDKITGHNLAEIHKLAKETLKLKVVSIDGKRVWNPAFAGLARNAVQVKHEKGTLSLPISTISEADKQIIMSWSDGTWKIEQLGLHGPSATGDTYKEIVFEDGKFQKNISFLRRDNDSVILKSSDQELKFPLSEVANLAGRTRADEIRFNDWIEEIIQERMKTAKPKTTSKFLSFDESDELMVTNVTVKILQILDEGLLASGFVGTLHKGTNLVRWTETVTVKHPVTGKDVTRVTNISTGRMPVEEAVSDDLCYIVGDTAKLTENQIVKAEQMKLEGNYKYIDVRGAPRKVRKYRVESD
jgi:hypothetical protein